MRGRDHGSGPAIFLVLSVCPKKSLMDDKNKKPMKPDDQIQALVQAAGARPDKTIICSCGTGREATNQFLLIRFYLGY